MIFAMDLDNTMIYSNRYINEYNLPKVQQVEFIEESSTKVYMSKYAIEELKKLVSKIHIVPTTTRSIDEFFRINTFEFCEYAITTNGATILHNKEPLIEWEKHIGSILKNYNKDIERIIKLLTEQEFIQKKPIFKDNKYIFCRINNQEKCREFLEQNINKEIWKYTIQGTKLYIIHKDITKSNAILYLRKILNSNYIISAGDSIMDKDMLEIADYSIIPKHGELYIKYKNENNYSYFVREGIFAANDIIEKVKELINNNN